MTRQRKQVSNVTPPKENIVSEPKTPQNQFSNPATGIESDGYAQVLESGVLCILLYAAQRCFSNHFQPQHGASWQDPWWTIDAQGLIMLAVKMGLTYEDRFLPSGLFDSSMVWQPLLISLLVAWQQPLLNMGLEQIRPGLEWVLTLVYFSPLLGTTWHSLDTFAREAVGRYLEGTNDPTRSIIANGAGTTMFFAIGAITRKLLGWAPRLFPYDLLPSGFLLPWIVTVCAAIVGIRLIDTKQLSRATYVAFIAALLFPILHGMIWNTHAPWELTTTALNAQLNHEGYELLARGDGRATGYASVIQNNKDGFRALRCDHSLLGGFWLNSPGLVKDPIYGVFVMLEAIRLVVPTSTTKARSEHFRHLAKTGSVLNIGLGIGTAPAAFIHHGMDVTIVEIDQIVYDFAVEYFHLPPRHKAIIGDAVDFVHKSQQKLKLTTDRSTPQSLHETADGQYDFIVHDVFTGGVEPAALFTAEFLLGLRDLLHPDGAIAINYAGDLSLPSAKMILRTILAVFGTCQVFRETAEDPQATGAADQTNVVVFCRKTTETFMFRRPEKEDYLGSPSREMWLEPKHRVDLKSFEPACGARGDCLEGPDPEGELLWRKRVPELERWQAEAGKRHWELMRDVIPPPVWDNW